VSSCTSSDSSPRTGEGAHRATPLAPPAAPEGDWAVDGSECPITRASGAICGNPIPLAKSRDTRSPLGIGPGVAILCSPHTREVAGSSPAAPIWNLAVTLLCVPTGGAPRGRAVRRPHRRQRYPRFSPWLDRSSQGLAAAFPQLEKRRPTRSRLGGWLRWSQGAVLRVIAERLMARGSVGAAFKWPRREPYQFAASRAVPAGWVGRTGTAMCLRRLPVGQWAGSVRARGRPQRGCPCARKAQGHRVAPPPPAPPGRLARGRTRGRRARHRAAIGGTATGRSLSGASRSPSSASIATISST
jgi:hypothetical protein